MDWREELRAQRDRTERWIRDKNVQVAQLANDAEARGRKLYGDAIRSGHDVVAKTTAELRELGLSGGPRSSTRTANGQGKGAERPPARAPARSAETGKNGSRAAQAAASGAVDEFTLGLADPALAAGGAVADAVRGGGLAAFGDRYRDRLAEKHAEDLYDERNYGLERGVGRAIGFGGSLLVGGVGARAAQAAIRGVPAGAKVLALLAKAPRLKPAVDPRGMLALSSVGGATAGTVGQVVNDVVSQRRGSLGDYGGAIAGGALGGIAMLRGGAIRGGAAGGVATSVTQDLLNGRRPSIEGAIEAARGGALTANLGAGMGTYGSAAAPVRIKGKIGEALTGARLVASGEGIPMPKQSESIGNGRHSIPDWKINGRYVEAKFGPNADLTKNQRILRRQQPDNFSVDAWSSGDVGKIMGTAGAGFGSQLLDHEDYPWLLPR